MDLVTLIAVVVGFGSIGGMMMSGNRRLDRKVDGVEIRLDRLDTKLTAQIKDVDERQTAQLTSVDERLSAQIKDVDERLTARIDRFETSVSERFDRFDTKLTAQIRDVGIQLRQTDSRLTSQITALIPRPAPANPAS